MKVVRLPQLERDVSLKTNDRLLDALLAEQVDVLMACGGNGICATCHVFVLAGGDNLTPIGSREARSLARISGTNATSRLACQACVLGDGVEVRLPDGMYVESIDDIEALVGKRCRSPILHPADGRVLIQQGKIITRTAISSLRATDFRVGEADID